MATTDYAKAVTFQTKFPQTFKALQKLVMAMANYEKKRHKKTLFGSNKGLRAYEKFEGVLGDTISVMIVDGAIPKDVNAKECRKTLIEMIETFAEVFPNWQDAYSFADEYLTKNASAG